MKLRHLDLFSGIGGFSLGLERTGGFQTVAFCDSDKKTHLVLKKHWPNVPIFDDVSTLKGKDLEQLKLLQEDFPARICQSQEKAQDSQEQGVAFGGNSTGSLKKRSRSMSSQKMSQCFDLEDWIKCSGRSIRSGMMRSGTVYPLQPLAHLTKGTESGLWPTPTAMTGGQGVAPSHINGKHGWNLGAAVNDSVSEKPNKLWPTPTAVWRPMEGNVRFLRNKVMAGELDRQEAAQMIGKDVFEAQGKVPKMIWPTPAARDWKDSGYEPSAQSRKSPCLPAAVVLSEQLTSPTSGKLNPNWVEWLMGYPTGWTDLNN